MSWRVPRLRRRLRNSGSGAQPGGRVRSHMIRLADCCWATSGEDRVGLRPQTWWPDLQRCGKPLITARRAAGMVPGSLAVHWGAARQLCGSVSCSYLYLCTGLERARFGEALDRFDRCVVLGDALGCQMWIVEARSHDDSDTLDCSDSHVVDAVRLRTTIACQPHDRRRDGLNRHGGFSICFSQAG